MASSHARHAPCRRMHLTTTQQAETTKKCPETGNNAAPAAATQQPATAATNTSKSISDNTKQRKKRPQQKTEREEMRKRKERERRGERGEGKKIMYLSTHQKSQHQKVLFASQKSKIQGVSSKKGLILKRALPLFFFFFCKFLKRPFLVQLGLFSGLNMKHPEGPEERW